MDVSTLSMVGAFSIAWLTGFGFGFKLGLFQKVTSTVITGA